jgi:hypothetical protein
MTDQPECEVRWDGTKVWELDGNLHRLDGPAIEYCDGDREWYVNDMLHREDGPAVERANGGEKEWYFNNEFVDVDSQEEFEKILPLLQIKEVIDE